MGFDCLPSLFSSERGVFLCVASILISLCGPPCDIATHAHAHSACLQTGSALWGPDTKTHSATRHQDCPLGANTQSINRDLHSRMQALNSHRKSYKSSSSEELIYFLGAPDTEVIVDAIFCFKALSGWHEDNSLSLMVICHMWPNMKAEHL